MKLAGLFGRHASGSYRPLGVGGGGQLPRAFSWNNFLHSILIFFFLLTLRSGNKKQGA
jgi:hypothetical protein